MRRGKAARLSKGKAGMGWQWVVQAGGEKAGASKRQSRGVPDGAGGRQVFGEAVQSRKDVLKAQRRWGAELFVPSREDEEEVDAKELSWLLGKRLHRA